MKPSGSEKECFVIYRDYIFVVLLLGAIGYLTHRIMKPHQKR